MTRKNLEENWIIIQTTSSLIVEPQTAFYQLFYLSNIQRNILFKLTMLNHINSKILEILEKRNELKKRGFKIIIKQILTNWNLGSAPAPASPFLSGPPGPAAARR